MAMLSINEKQCVTLYNGFLTDYLGRNDHLGVSEEEIIKAENKLGVRLPVALRLYYLILGKVEEFNQLHNKFKAPSELCIEDDYLMFMDENQFVVSWGFKICDLKQGDPVVWQRNNTEPYSWYSEEMCFSEFMESLFAWYKEIGLF